MSGSPLRQRMFTLPSRRGPLAVFVVVTLVLVTTTLLTLTTRNALAVGTPLACDQNTIYGINSSGQMDSINASTGATASVISMAPGFNALGATLNGTAAYSFDGTDNDITKYNTTTGTVSTFTNVDSSAPASLIRGAVNPATGIYYYAGGGATSVYLGAWNTNTDTPIGHIGTITGLTTGNGDIAFSTRGLMFLVSSNEVLRVDATTVPTTTGTATLTTSVIATLPGGTNSPGIAFSTDGYLYASNGATILKIDPAAGTVLSTTPLSGSFSPTDLASCNYPNTVTAETDITDRVSSTDQFGLAVTGGGITTGNTATTTGTSNGLQSATAGAALALSGDTYTFTETASGTTDLSDYVITYSCSDVNSSTVITTGTGSSGSFLFPAATGSAGIDVVCTFTNTPTTATIDVTKALSHARSNSTDQFTVAVHSTSASGPVLNSTTHSTTAGSGATVTAGSGTTTATSIVANRTYYLTEQIAAGSASTLAQYAATITCTDGASLQTGLPTAAAFNGSLAITPVSNSAIACTLSNDTIAPTISVNAALSSARVAGVDQFTVALRTGSGAGPVVSSTAASTTTGSGSTVTGGTGTTGTFAGVTGTTYFVTESASADGSDYGTTISCTDANGFQTGLPSGAAFTGSFAITPVSGAAISCTLTSSSTPTSLSLSKSNPSALVVGAVTSYSLGVTNNGGLPGGSHVLDQLPPDIAYVSATGTGWTCSATGSVTSGQLVTCAGGPVAGGTTSDLMISVQPDDAAAGTSVVNRGAVDPTGGSSPVTPSTCTATGTPAGCAVTAAMLVTTPHLDIVKTADLVAPATDPVHVGDRIVFSYTVTNDSQVAIDDLTVLDPMVAGVNCPVSTLAAGATTVCTSTPYTVTAADVAAGEVTGPAAAVGDLPGCTGTPGSSTCPIVASAFSAVSTPATARAADPLAITGVPVDGLLLEAGFALLLGFMLLLIARRRTLS